MNSVSINWGHLAYAALPHRKDTPRKPTDALPNGTWWGELQTELNSLSKQGEWEKMGTLIDDDILNTFAVVGEPENVPKEVLRRYGDVTDRISFYAPYQSDPDRWSKVLAGFKS